MVDMDVYGTCMVHVWYMYGTCMVHVWYMYVVYVVYTTSESELPLIGITMFGLKLGSLSGLGSGYAVREKFTESE